MGLLDNTGSVGSFCAQDAFQIPKGVAATDLQSCYRKVKSLLYSLLILCSKIRGGASLGWSPCTWGNPGYLCRMHPETSGIPTFPSPDIA